MIKLVSITRTKDGEEDKTTYYENDKEIKEDKFYLSFSRPVYYENRETFYFDDGFETRRMLLMEDK